MKLRSSVAPFRTVVPIRFGLVDKEMQPVEKVDLTSAPVRIEKEQVDLGMSGLNPFSHTFGHDMVGDAPEGLQAEHIRYSIFDQCADLACDQPPFAILVVQRHELSGELCDVMDGVIWAVVAVSPHPCVHLIQVSVHIFV